MGGGASKTNSNAGKDSSVAIKEIKERAERLEREVEKLETEKMTYEKKLGDRSSDIEKLGELNRTLEREKESLKDESEKSKLDQRSAEKAMEVLRREIEEVKANAKRFEANLREINGDFIAEKEDHAEARKEIERIGEILTEKVKETEEIEKRVMELEEEKQELDNMLRLTSESADMYKNLSSKLMVKKPKEDTTPAPALAAPTVQPSERKASVEDIKVEQSTQDMMLSSLKPKQAGRFKVCIISTFEDFFLEREALKKHTVRQLGEWCEKHNCVLEMIDLWESVLRDQYTVITHGFYVPTLYFQEIEDSDVVLLLLSEKYGPDVSEETCATEASWRTWMNRHRSQHNRYGSILELAAVYAAFVVGKDSNLPQHLVAPRVITYIRDPAFVQGLPEAQTKHFSQEGSRQTAKLEQLKARLTKAGLVRNGAYADPHALSHQIQEDLQSIFEKSQKKPIGDIDLEFLKHEAFMDVHKWIGQGEKGVQLPDNVSSVMERVRKPVAVCDTSVHLGRYVVNDTPQPLVIVGEVGTGRTSMCEANVRALAKRFPPPDTLIISHFTGVSNAAKDPILWMLRVCKILKNELSLQLRLPHKPSEMISDFPLWLEAASATGKKIFLILDGIDQMAQKLSSEDPIGFLPKSMPEGIRCILSTGPGNALTSLAQRGCGAVTIWPMDDKQKETLVNAYLGRKKKEFDKKGIQKLVNSKLCSIPQFLTKTLAEIDAIGVLDGRATMEPMLYYLEADNMNILTEKAVYRWESAYNGKIIGGSLVRDVLTCIWASRRGLRRSEISGLMRLSPSQLSPLLLSVRVFLTTQTGLFNFQSQSLIDTVVRRYLPTSDAEFEAHKHLANFFNDPDNASLSRRGEELPWQMAQANDPEALCKCITKAPIFRSLYREEYRHDLFDYVNYLEQRDAHLQLGGNCKISMMGFEQQTPKPEIEEVVELTQKYGSWLAEIGFMEVSLQFLLKAMEGWSEVLEEDDLRVAATCETLAKVLANMRSPESEKYFQRAEKTRQRLNKKTGPTNEFGTLCNEYGLYLKRQNKPQEAMRLFIRAQDIWSRVWGPDHLMVANALLNLSTVCYAVGSLQQAHEYCEQALEIRRNAVGSGHPLYAEALVNLAAIELARNRGGRVQKEAERQLLEGIDIFERTRGGQHQDTLWARSFVGDEDQGFSDADDDDDDNTGDILEGMGAKCSCIAERCSCKT